MATKITEEQIVKVLRDPQYTSERQRSLALWPSPSGSHIKKFREIREKYGIPEPEPGKRGRAMSINKTEGQPGTLRFSDIRKDDRLLKGKKRLIVLSVDDEGMKLQRMDGSEYRLSRKQFEAIAGEYTKVPAGDPQGSPVKTYTDPTLKVADIKVCGQPIKNLPDSVKEKIVDKLKEGSEQFDADREQEGKIKSVAEVIFPGARKPATINPDFEAAFQEVEAELEAKKKPAIASMEDVAVNMEPDYIDPEWFDKPIPRKGTVERVIWDRAYKEISEIQTLRNVIRTALDSGDRLPTVYVDKYNKYVSKYSEEAGA